MDLAVILPLAVLFFLQSFLALLLLAPRAISRHVATQWARTQNNTVVNAVTYTIAGLVGAMALSSLVQLMGVLGALKQTQFGDR